MVFDRLFRDLVSTNSEGRVVASLDCAPTLHGLPLTEDTVTRFIYHEPLGATSAACLALA